jgi:signal transduction histidine kinase
LFAFGRNGGTALVGCHAQSIPAKGPMHFPRSLSSQLVIIALLVAVVPVTLFGVLAIREARATTSAEVMRSGQEIARRAAGEVHAIVAGQRAIVHSLAVALGQVRGAPDRMRAIVREFRLGFPTLGGVDVALLDGGAILATSARVSPSAGAMNGQDHVAVIRANRPYVGLVEIASDLEPELPIAEPLSNGTRIDASVAARVRLTGLWGAISAIQVGQRGRARLIVKTGRVIAHGDPLEQAALLKQAAGGEPPPVPAAELLGVHETRRADGEPMIAIGELVPELGWVVVVEQALAEALALSRSMTITLVGLVVVVVAAAGLAAWLLARRLARPMSELAAHAPIIVRAVEAGHQPPDVIVKGPADITALAGAMNHMSADLGRLYEHVRDTERMAIVARVGAGLAHDLRTPLVALENAARMLAETPDDLELRRLFSEQIARDFKRVHHFIANMEAMAESGRSPEECARIPVDLGAVVTRATQRLREGGLVPPGITLEVDASAVPRVLGNPDHLERIVENLLTNAFHAMNDRSGTIEVKVSADASEARLAVVDHGRGIEAERLPRLFKEFHSTRRGGFGIGLPLVRRMTEEMGGRVAVESRLGEGTCFTVHLPRDTGSETAAA